MSIDPREHVTEQIEAYLDNLLPPEERLRVERHLAVCSVCTEAMLKARWLARELGPTMRAALGHPVPRAALRHQVRRQLQAGPAAGSIWHWLRPGRVLNAAGTLVVVALLAVSVLAVIQGQLPGASVLSQIASLRPAEDGGVTPTASLPVTPPPQVQPTATPAAARSSAGDTLPAAPPFVVESTEPGVAPAPMPSLSQQPGNPDRLSHESGPVTVTPDLPGGTIAFAFYNPAPGRQVYETHLISPDGTNHRLFPLDGVSEPALHRSQDGSYRLAYRAWSEPTSPRSLLSSDLSGNRPDLIGGFWEDAQPDWSPTEDRLIFASQRETDRRWRLYTVWEDGSAELNLRREGKSPTFAPDGFRFAFEGCDETGNRCGLWLGNLSNSERGAKPFLPDSLARSPDWSPTGEEIAYMANAGDNWDLYLINSDGRNMRRLTDDPAVDGLPAWSPDGQWLAFLSNRGGNWGIWLLHPASGLVRQVYAFDGGTYQPPVRPPYGERHWWDEQISWSQ